MPTTTTRSTDKVVELQDKVVSRVLETLEGGSAPWVRPWTAVGGGLPFNASTGRKYSGSNIFYLWLMQQMHGYPTAGWMTFNQAKALGGSVRKGEKSEFVIFAKPRLVPALDENKAPVVTNGQPALKCVGMISSYYHVFNVAQIDGLPANLKNPDAALATLTEIERHAAADAFFAALPGTMRTGGDSAYYAPSADAITLPASNQFKDAGAYYATFAHEYIHWTGHESRLKRFGSDFTEATDVGAGTYAYEELIAEMGSAFICADLGLDGFLQHPSYIAHWAQNIRDKKQALFTAAAAASKAVAYLQALANDAMGVEEDAGHGDPATVELATAA